MTMIEFVSFVEVIKPMKHSLDQDPEVGACVADLVLVVGDDDEGAVGSLHHELLMALLTKASIPHGHDLVDEVAVELDGHGDGKRQSGHHPGRVGSNWLLKVAAKLGEVLDEGDLVLDRLAVDSANELEVIESGQLSLEGPAKGERPGEAHAAYDLTARGCLRSSDEAYEGGLTRSVSPKKADLLAPLDPKGDAVEDRALPSPNGVLLRNFPEIDHANAR